MEYGKFNSAEELLKGYNELEKSFTHKCQQLSELKAKLEQTNATNGGTNEDSSPLNLQEQSAAAAENTVVAVPADNVASSADNPRSVPQSQAVTTLPKVMSGGGNVPMAAPSKPKTLKEASLMAKELFKN